MKNDRIEHVSEETIGIRKPLNGLPLPNQNPDLYSPLRYKPSDGCLFPVDRETSDELSEIGFKEGGHVYAILQEIEGRDYMALEVLDAEVNADRKLNPEIVPSFPISHADSNRKDRLRIGNKALLEEILELAFENPSARGLPTNHKHWKNGHRSLYIPKYAVRIVRDKTSSMLAIELAWLKNAILNNYLEVPAEKVLIDDLPEIPNDLWSYQ